MNLNAGFAKLDLEIGAGQGLHAVHYCQENPDRLLLAVEKTHVRFAGLSQRRESHPHLENLIALQADAVAFVSHFLPPESLDRVFLLYPNPYPKPKQSNLRWHNRPFFAELIKKMKSGAELTLATNLEWYAKEAAMVFTGQWQLEMLEFKEVDPKQTPRTHFEKKYLLRGETCWNLKFRKLAL
ncbi:MAG: tRNA (guanine(46)-N(7))-methyltransferase TrmB [Bdellovibrionales bacterium]